MTTNEITIFLIALVITDLSGIAVWLTH